MENIDKRAYFVGCALSGLAGASGFSAALICPEKIAEGAVRCADEAMKAMAERRGDEAPGPVVAGPATDETEAERRDGDWGEAVEKAVADAVEMARVRGESDEEMADRIARAAIAADRTERGVVLPPDWVAVPKKITGEMIKAWSSEGPTVTYQWPAILAAAPPCPGVEEGQ